MTVRITPIIIFVTRFETCYRFYRYALGLHPLRTYKGKDHPRWAEFQVGTGRLALHAQYAGPRFRQGQPVALHFDVPDIRKTIKKIRQYGGRVMHGPTRYDFRPAELQIALAATFRDPDGNVFEVQQVLRRFRA